MPAYLSQGDRIVVVPQLFLLYECMRIQTIQREIAVSC